jgi:hypothetical protein
VKSSGRAVTLSDEEEDSNVSFFSGSSSLLFPFSSSLLPLPCSAMRLEVRPPEAAVKKLEGG